MKLDIPSDMMQEVLTWLEGWSRTEIYLNMYPGEERFYQQDTYFNDIKGAVLNIGKYLKRKYGKQIAHTYPTYLGKKDLNKICLGLAATVVVAAFSKRGKELGGKMDVLLLRLCSLEVDNESLTTAQALLDKIQY